VQPTAFPPDLLARSAAEGVRLVALAYLEQAADAIGRLDDPADLEALHDFRVAVRRLRSTLRAYRPLFAPSITKRQRRRLRDLGDRTNAGRDAEVQVAWLRDQEPRLEPRERGGQHWLVARLEARRTAEYEATLRDVRAEFPRIARRLRSRLEEYRARVPVTGEPAPSRFGPAAADALATAATEFGDRLAAVRAPEDAAPAHAARIAAKRVRYVLEPLAEHAPGGPSLVRRLKSLQDLLGEINDCHVLDAEIAAGVAETGAARARRLLDVTLAEGSDAARRAGRAGRDPRRGLVAVARLVRARRHDLFLRLEEEWLADGGRGFAAELALAVAGLREEPGPWRPRRRARQPTPRGPRREA
jgi:CHAD domain-containing protein